MSPTAPRRSNSPRLKVPRLDLTVRTLDPDDDALLKDLEAAAHLQRTTARQLVADIVARALGPKFAQHIAA